MWRLLAALAGGALLIRWVAAMASAPYRGNTPAEFIAWIGPHARESNRRHGIPASVIIAQAALESGWGRSRLTRLANNLFGVKAGRRWPGPVISATTGEFIGGQWVTVEGNWRVYPNTAAALADGRLRESLFRVYHGPLDSLRDHARVLFNGLYHVALANRTDPEAFAHALTGVYATDPRYGSKLVSIMRTRSLTVWDVPQAQWALDPGVVPPAYLV